MRTAQRVFAWATLVAVIVFGGIVYALSRSGSNASRIDKKADSTELKKTDEKANSTALKINKTLRCLSMSKHPQSCLDRVAGAVGPGGATGATGATGRRGLSVTGERGQRGEKGDTGAPSRISGPIGKDGSAGPQGVPGEKGADGGRGEQGVKGDPGSDGADAPPNADPVPGPPGMDGQPGVPGVQGPPGASAQPFTWSWIDTLGVTHVCTVDPTLGPDVVQACAPVVPTT